jgi:DNA uptake protein ComE-like DNA-binding protein
MQIGDLSRTRSLCERRDNAVLQAMRVLLVIGLMAGGSLALWLSAGSSPPVDGIVIPTPPQTLADGGAGVELPLRPERVQVATADPAAAIPAASAPLEVASHPASAPKDTERAPTMESPVPLTPDQAAAELEQAAVALERPAPPVPDAATDVNMTGTVAQHASLAAKAPAESPTSGLVDLNKASFEQLNALKGAGALGRAIIRGRPYRSVDDLVKKRVLRRTVYERIKGQVTVQ